MARGDPYFEVRRVVAVAGTVTRKSFRLGSGHIQALTAHIPNQSGPITASFNIRRRDDGGPIMRLKQGTLTFDAGGLLEWQGDIDVSNDFWVAINMTNHTPTNVVVSLVWYYGREA